MRIQIVLLFTFLSILVINAQEVKGINPVYRAENEKINKLVHTKLKVEFDYDKRYLLGEAWLTLKPYFYNTSELILDAKGMLIHKVFKNGKDLKYVYDDKKLKINLGNTYSKDDDYTIYIKYTARPEEIDQEGGEYINDAKGLYFIDPDGTDPDKPTQIWTQGETESSSCWFPTIDSPNQKSTQEIYITVQDKYITLSNGLLLKQTKNKNGTRTDYWKLDQKHAPYLFFMGIGEYSIIKDKWKNIQVDYYVEKEYEPYAKEIFGLTPEMIKFYSDYTGVPFVWPKYAQIVGRDFVSGAMENTTAVLHNESAYQLPGQLIDENIWEYTIAHELFHHWFGNLVTTESWSNLTVNESFANYSEYLWIEYKHGSDQADDHRRDVIDTYFSGDNELKDLVRFHYNSRDDMFDAVSYNKGGAILHMLREYIGENAFRAGLKLYLNENAYGAAEAHQLRLAFEEVTGKDLNLFFNQWFFNNGHPKLEITYDYSEQDKFVAVNIKQTQGEMFEFPLAIDVYEGATPKRYDVWIDKKNKSFSFKVKSKPNLVNVGANKTLLAEINDHKSVENYIHQYNYASKYEDRREAIIGLSENQNNNDVFITLTKALNDSYFGLRIMAIEKIDISKTNSKGAIKILEKLAVNDPKTLVQAAAIKKLGLLQAKGYASLYTKAIESKSFAVKGSAINSLYDIDRTTALIYVNSITDETVINQMKDLLIPMYIRDRIEKQMPFVAENLMAGMFLTDDNKTQNIYKEGFQWVVASDNEEATQNLVDNFVETGMKYQQYGLDKMVNQILHQVLAIKKASNYSNKDTLVKIVEDGLSRIK